jgi:hypothetical protein
MLALEKIPGWLGPAKKRPTKLRPKPRAVVRAGRRAARKDAKRKRKR